MLTRDLLLFRARQGKVRPSFIDAERADLLGLAEDLISVLEEGRSKTRGQLEEDLELCIEGFPPKLARGLIKLLLDRADFEEPLESIAAQRSEAFAKAAGVLRSLQPLATLEHYEACLAEALPLEEIRRSLYADLPDQRLLLEWKKLTPRQLLERYNMALAQGLVLYCRSLVVEVLDPELLRVRRLLRWLKFCRLVAQVFRHDKGWTLEIEGPAAILDMEKKYGLQLAMFLPAVPVLRRFRLEAVVELPRREPSRMELTHKEPLVCPYDDALGHIPPEIELVARKFADEGWELDSTPEPRISGAKDLCVPDFLFRHRATGAEVAFELFHRWHHHALARRLEGLASRPDPRLFLGVDRWLSKQPDWKERLAEHPQVMHFNAFPSERGIREILRRSLEALKVAPDSSRKVKS